jgi:hypothetical protein
MAIRPTINQHKIELDEYAFALVLNMIRLTISLIYD